MGPDCREVGFQRILAEVSLMKYGENETLFTAPRWET
jgi:hypothetical protein